MKKVALYLNIFYAILLVFVLGMDIYLGWIGVKASYFVLAVWVFTNGVWWILTMMLQKRIDQQREIINELRNEVFTLRYPPWVSQR